MLPSQARLLLCHLDNDLVIIIYIYCSSAYTYDLHKPYLGAFFFSRYPSVAVARNHNVSAYLPNTVEPGVDLSHFYF